MKKKYFGAAAHCIERKILRVIYPIENFQKYECLIVRLILKNN